jgi:hypothetical protein
MPMYSACGNAVLPALGFPIRESADHRLFSAYPRLIAAVHALHRLLVPRHPPCALLILTVITRSRRPPERKAGRARGDTRFHWLGCAVFKVRKEAQRPGLGRSVSQNSTAWGARACARAPPGPVDVSGAAPIAVGTRGAGAPLLSRRGMRRPP